MPVERFILSATFRKLPATSLCGAALPPGLHIWRRSGRFASWTANAPGGMDPKSGFPAAIRDTADKLQTLLKELDEMTQGSAKKRKMRRVSYTFAPTGDAIESFSVPFEDAYKKEGRLPSRARGLFILRTDNGAQIVVRGYDKFFNIGETKWTQWNSLAESTRAPYEMTLKENGCIIFVSALKGHLIVTSKHALGQPHVEGQPYTHAQKGEQWLDIHLNKAGKTRAELTAFLAQHNATAVFELTDDDFEEHVLEYPPERRGLHLHGINFNTIDFKTWPADSIHRFAEQFGFVKVGVVMKDSLDEVKALADECAETGSYEQRPIEGFVVRCKTKDSKDEDFENYFFKVKFDEPYLMYREWREVTKQLLKERQPFKNYRYELTYKYVEFARRKMKEDPALFENFLQNKGIIRARNLFLEEAGISNPERYAHMLTEEGMKQDAAAAAENRDSDQDEEPTAARAPANGAAPATRSKILRGSSKTLLVPIACIGCGKTTLGLVLSALYGAGHVQNDDITAKKNPADHFNKAILEQFHDRDIVFADRNNHKSIHRSNLSQTIRTELPGCKIVALHWAVDPKRAQEILDITVKRVVDRGENHQSLTPGRTQNFKSVMSSFIRQRDPLDLSSPADKLIDEVVELEVGNSVEDNVRKVARALGLRQPTDEELAAAVGKALEYRPTVIKEVKGSAPQGAPRYYGIRFDNVSLKDLLASHVFGNAEASDRSFFDALVEGKRIPDKHHVTLVFIGDLAKKLGKMKDFSNLDSLPEKERDKARLFHYYHTAMQEQQFPPSANGAQPGDGSLAVNIELDRVIWDGRVMVLPARNFPLESENKHPHVTVATAADEIKAVESNQLLQAIERGDAKEWKELTFPPLLLHGHLEAFWN